MRRLKGCPNGSASTAWDYAGLLFNLYRDAGPKCSHQSLTSHAQPQLNPFYTWYNILVTSIALFHRNQRSPPPAFKFLHTPLMKESLTQGRI